jgi:PAS domain S-box-containing protein
VPGIEGQYRYDDYGPELLRAFREGRTVVRNDIANDPTLTSAEKDAHAVLQLGSTVNMPLVKEGQLVAILFAHFIDAHDWTENELALMQETAERIWAAVERARAEAAQHASEEKYRTLFNSIDEGFCIIEMLLDESGRPADYRFLETNAAFEKQTGLQNCIGKTVREILPNHDAHWFEIYGRIARTGISERFEDPATALDRYYDVYAFRIGEPEARHVAVIFQDVSERKRSEAALRESESRQRFLLKLSDALRPHYDTAEIQREASRVLGEHLAANRVAYFEVMDDDYIVNHDYVNGVPNIAGRYPIHSFGETLLSIYQKGQPVTSADVQADAQLTPAERAAYASIQIGAYIGVPLVKQGRFVAGLAVHVAHPREWTALDVSLAQETAERTWAAIERAQAEQALHQLNAQLEQRVLDRTEALRQSHEQLQELSVHMEHAREDERTRIAREVHDELGGNLTALKIDLGSLATGRDADAALTQRIHDLKEHIDMIVRIVRRIGSDLRPPVLDDFGLVPAMEWHAREWERRTGIQCRLDLIEITSPISREKRTAVFRVFQEALTNVARHAQATRVNVTTGVDEGDLMLMIEDDGVGIRAGELDFSRSLGLKGMQERMKEVGGVVEIEGEAGQGTIIAIRVPLSEGTHTNE